MYMPQSNDSDFTPPPDGNHAARCYRVIDLGTQEVEWQGQKKFQHKVLISWELPTEMMPEPAEPGTPFSIHQRYTLSSSDKSRLRKDLESWRGKPFEESDFGPGGFKIENLLGAPCLLNVVHAHKDSKTYANIAAISRLPKGMVIPDPINKTVYFSLAPDEFNPNVFSELSEGLQNVIRKSPEWQEVGGESVTSQFRDDTGSAHTNFQRVGNVAPGVDQSEDDLADLDDEIPF